MQSQSNRPCFLNFVHIHWLHRNWALYYWICPTDPRTESLSGFHFSPMVDRFKFYLDLNLKSHVSLKSWLLEWSNPLWASEFIVGSRGCSRASEVCRRVSQVVYLLKNTSTKKSSFTLHIQDQGGFGPFWGIPWSKYLKLTTLKTPGKLLFIHPLKLDLGSRDIYLSFSRLFGDN